MHDIYELDTNNSSSLTYLKIQNISLNINSPLCDYILLDISSTEHHSLTAVDRE